MASTVLLDRAALGLGIRRRGQPSISVSICRVVALRGSPLQLTLSQSSQSGLWYGRQNLNSQIHLCLLLTYQGAPVTRWRHLDRMKCNLLTWVRATDLQTWPEVIFPRSQNWWGFLGADASKGRRIEECRQGVVARNGDGSLCRKHRKPRQRLWQEPECWWRLYRKIA